MAIRSRFLVKCSVIHAQPQTLVLLSDTNNRLTVGRGGLSDEITVEQILNVSLYLWVEWF